MQILVKAAAIGIALTLAGCGAASKSSSASSDAVATTTTVAKVHKDIEIVNKGFSEVTSVYGNTHNLYYGVLLKNPNPTSWVAEGTGVTMTFYDAKDAVTKTLTKNLSMLLPGQTNAVGDSESDVEGATRMEVQIAVDKWEETTIPLGVLTSDAVATKATTNGGEQTNATIKSTFAKAIKNVQATAIYYAADGSILGGRYSYGDSIPANGSNNIEINTRDTIPKLAKTEVYPNFTLTSLDDLAS